ncbi:amidohydrolase family protein, partial [Candidatus Bathyarchaeota archaeon]|nr:amidohydrolase family protein [Candidatus Bathyarchaeota archaeon]
MMKADLILKGGQVLTMNPAMPYAEALAIKADRILKVGAEAEIAKYADEKTTIIDLKGKTVVPGFIDTHVHLTDFGKILAWLDLSDAKSIEDIKAKVKARCKGAPKARWILGRGWHEENLAEKRPPTADDLDEAAPDNPVILYRREGRVCAVNSKALTLAGITENTPSPPGGEIEKNPATGKPTGILIESATDLVWRNIPEQSPDEILENIDLAFRKLLENGITSIHWIVSSPSEKRIIKKLAERPALPVRTRVIIPYGMLE